MWQDNLVGPGPFLGRVLRARNGSLAVVIDRFKSGAFLVAILDKYNKGHHKPHDKLVWAEGMYEDTRTTLK